MSPSNDERRLQASVLEILHAFCGDDPGRSVAFQGRNPTMPRLSIRGQEPRPAASVIKLALAMAVVRKGARGDIDLAARVPVRTLTPTRYVSILPGFDRDHQLSVREICRLALMTSDNPLAIYLQRLADF